FLAMLAHELRNPLAPLRNAADLLKLLAFSRDELQGVEDVVDRQVAALTRLVDDLLDVSRITRGKIELRREPISVAELLARAVELSQPLLDSRSHQLHVNVPAEELSLDGDLTRLTQVLANLLNNAAKYTPPGGEVSLSAWRENGDVVVCVQDNGIGIAPQQLSRVFELFTQLDTAHDRSHGGLGVGLTLVRSLVEMHGGTVRAYSDGAGRGCRFNVRLPAAPAAPLLRHAPEPMARRAAH
ncbi:MAG TPA: HAMP domain-containing sensor histidine kinase, partial [Candidatus Binatia bacterium]|nr:HAMP domain-containing sensor histidine kinase [Candidatus Binatia bacterium]